MWTRTIVTAYLNVNSRNRTTAEYLGFSKGLLEAKCPMIIFIDKQIANQVIAAENLKVIEIDKTYIYLLEKYSKNPESFANFSMVNGNKQKDSIEFMSIMCNKTEFMREAIAMNPFGTDGFVWLDFGMKHVCPEISDEEYSTQLETLAKKPIMKEEETKVRIGQIWDFQYFTNGSPLLNIQWFFAGGVFGGTATPLLEFADRTRSKCLEIIELYKIITWEVNVWYFIYTEAMALFSPYKCNHNVLLIKNYG
jgi:hypothetical protein